MRRVKLVPNSPRLVDWTPHLASPGQLTAGSPRLASCLRGGEARRVASCHNVLITQISRRNCILYVTDNIDAGAVGEVEAVSDTRWWMTRGPLVTQGPLVTWWPLVTLGGGRHGGVG